MLLHPIIRLSYRWDAMFLTLLKINKIFTPNFLYWRFTCREINRITSLGCDKVAINTKQGVIYVCTKDNYRLLILKRKSSSVGYLLKIRKTNHISPFNSISWLIHSTNDFQKPTICKTVCHGWSIVMNKSDSVPFLYEVYILWK